MFYIKCPYQSQMRARQKTLFESCSSLLDEIHSMGGQGHETIKASVLEQLADTSLSRVDEYRARQDQRLLVMQQLFSCFIGRSLCTIQNKAVSNYDNIGKLLLSHFFQFHSDDI